MTFHHVGPFRNLWIMAYKATMQGISLHLTFFLHMHQSENSRFDPNHRDRHPLTQHDFDIVPNYH